MMELIDRDDFRQRMFRAFAMCSDVPANNVYQILMNWLDCALQESPTIDAKPVIHGHWEDASLISSGTLLRNSENIVEHRCSVCKKWSTRLELVNEDLFCPNCGTKMDEVQK